MERVTRQNLERRCENLNLAMARRRSGIRYIVQGRNGSFALDRVCSFGLDSPEPSNQVIDTVWIGSKREIADFLHAMLTALIDSTPRGAMV